jgi:hypothetical protein
MRYRTRPAQLAAGIFFLLLFGLFASCSDDPTGASSTPAMTGRGDVDPKIGDSFLLSSVDMGPGFEGPVEVWAYDLATEGESAVGFDLVLVNKTGGNIQPPLFFVITSIVPNTVTCLNPEPTFYEGDPFFDFSDDMGDDNVLSPGEATARVHARFGWPEPMAFSIGFRIVIGDVVRNGVIGGVVFGDIDEDGVRDDGEMGLADVPVELMFTWGDSAGTTLKFLGRTDPRGHYEFIDLPAGVYRIAAQLQARFTTPNPLLVTLVELPDGNVSKFLDANFGVAGQVPPPPPPPADFVFGPVPVGPASGFGTELDSTFVIGPPMPPFPPNGVMYFVRVEAPAIAGPFPMYIDEIAVSIDGQLVYKFECPPDTLCPPPFAKMIIDPALMGEGEHAISIKVLGSEMAFELVGIERDASWEWAKEADDARR